MKEDKILAWHFGNQRLGHGDDRIMRIGVRQRFKPQHKNNRLVMCLCGLHASRNVYDALCYARGTIIRRVELSGSMIIDSNKICAEYRKTLWIIPGEKLLRRFACLCAIDVKDNWEKPISPIVSRWLYTQNESIRNAAQSAAWSATQGAVWSAAWSAAKSAAQSAAWSATKSAAESAAKSAAQSAARSAAWSAAKDAAQSATQGVAQSAAQSAAWSAAESAAQGAAQSAAKDAAQSAAWSTTQSAARSAVWNAVWSAAESAAKSVAEKRQQQRLLRMIYTTKRRKS